MVARRHLLQAAALTGGAALLPSATAHAQAAAEPEGTVTDLGPASVTTPLGNGEIVGSVLYAGTRGLSPNLVGGYDLTTDAVTSHTDIPSGIGVWAMCRVGTDVYVGTHSRSDLYRLDTLTGALDRVGAYPYHFIWNLASAPDGKVYLAISEPGRVVEYDPATGESRDLGVTVDGEAYVRSIAADETTVYAGVGAHAHLIAIDRATGAKRDILPAALAGRDFVASLTLSDTHLAAGISSNGEVLVLNKADPADHRVLATGEKYVTSVLIHDRYVYFAGRPSGMLYRCATDGGAVETLGVAQPEAATHRLLVRDGLVYGVQDGAIVVVDPADRSLRYVNLVQRGFRAAPEEPMSVHSDGRRVYVGGKGGADIHDLATGTRTRVGIPGEPKTALTVRDATYLGVYTQALLYRHRAGEPEATLLAGTGNQQDRPRDLAYDEATGLIAMTTQPEPGHLNGTLALYAPRTGRFDTYRPVVERQSLYAVTCRAGVAYLGTNIQEGLGLPPVTTTARLAAFDLRSRRLCWQVEPMPGAKVIPGLAHTALAVYGITDSGVLFEYDLLRRQVTRTTKVGARGADLHIVRRVAYTTDGNAVHKIDLVTFTVTTIVDGLTGEWFGAEPKLALDPSRRALFGLKERNLVRITIAGH
ncbi:DNA-binding beta-propeller fold protein YncE [Micromonospora coriariae]|uniref:DNA-binding beta-propeller fold protein YncE n=1 Tax=Micromonospora coriariae TaxID=285665 RepID=A0A1C4X5H7_9ACTN|nr:PQQ-like beta-propeller repeat protein [Micromonospora coriariae]SCF03686.1 DNA-binding beta-propeller fold protein YncE [Micromonospora coriariae]